MKIEIGKSYKTRNGRKATVVGEDKEHCYPWEILTEGREGTTWHLPDGSICLEDEDSRKEDLVAEWDESAPESQPAHYASMSIQPSDAIESWGLCWPLGNVIKYVARAGKKGQELEDLRKAADYLQRRIKQLEAK